MAFGVNRQIGSVCSVAVNFGFQKSATDRCSIESKTDDFGFGLLGSVFWFNRSNRSENREEQIEREKENARTGKNKSAGSVAHRAAHLVAASMPHGHGRAAEALSSPHAHATTAETSPRARIASPSCRAGHRMPRRLLQSRIRPIAPVPPLHFLLERTNSWKTDRDGRAPTDKALVFVRWAATARLGWAYTGQGGRVGRREAG